MKKLDINIVFLSEGLSIVKLLLENIDPCDSRALLCESDTELSTATAEFDGVLSRYVTE